MMERYGDLRARVASRRGPWVARAFAADLICVLARPRGDPGPFRPASPSHDYLPMSPSRRSVLKHGLGAAAAMLLPPIPACAASQPSLIRKPIPSTGEQLPVIGLGSAGTFNLRPESPGWADAREVIRLFRELGGKVVATAPTYQRSELFIGETIRDLAIGDGLFLATKVNVGDAGKQAAAQQMENSLRVFGRTTVDLIQVWN